MKNTRVYIDYINDILDAIKNIKTFVKDITFDSFSNDIKTQFAVIRALEIIGEASKKIPSEIKTTYSEIPWK